MTNTPWEAEPAERGAYLIRAGKIAIAKTYEPRQSLHAMIGPDDAAAIAALIVCAVNSRAAIVEALENIAGGIYSRELMSDAALEEAGASPAGKAAWQERCICELQEMASAALALMEGRE